VTAAGLRRSAKLYPLIDEISDDPVENVKEDRFGGNAAAGAGFRMVSIFTPLIDEINALPVENSIVFTVAAFRVAKVVKPITDKDPAVAALVTVKEFTPAAPDTVKAPIVADVAAKVPVTVLLRVNREPPEIDPLITAVAPLTAPVALRILSPTFPLNEPLVPEIAPNEVKEPTWALFVTRIALLKIPLFA